MKQVVMEKSLGRWKQRRTEWVKDELAATGKCLKRLLQRTSMEVWEDGWEIVEVLPESDARPPAFHDRIDWEEAPRRRPTPMSF